VSNQISSSNLQQDLLILLCFNNEKARTLCGLLKPEYFDAIYARIVEVVIRYVNQFGDAPGDALPAVLDDIMSKDDAVGKTTKEICMSLLQSRDQVNAKYAIDRLHAFIRRQVLREGIIAASMELQGDVVADESIDAAEKILLESLRRRIEVFEPGTFLGDADEVLKFLNLIDDQTFPTGIRELDSRQAGPVRGGLHLFVAPAKAGKTAWLCHLGKMAMLNRMRIAHISLEMSEPRVISRYMQGMFSVGKRATPTARTDWNIDDQKRFTELIRTAHTPSLSLDADDIREQLRNRITRMKGRLQRIVVKSFATGTLTVEALVAYLDLLADSTGFVPDIILLDYADLMRFDGKDFRIALGNLYKQLRGIAGERDVAIATVTQANRSASRVGRTSAEDVAEDWSKIATADTVLTYASSAAEREMGLARITVAAHRNDEDKFSVVISQNYASGQFALKSAPMNNTYYDRIKDAE